MDARPTNDARAALRSKMARNARPSPVHLAAPPAPVRRKSVPAPKPRRTAPIGTIPAGTVQPASISIDTAGAKEKAIDRIASEVLRDLQAGTLVDYRNKKPLTNTISNRALGGYTTSSDSRRDILRNLARRGVVEIQGNGSAKIAAAYRPGGLTKAPPETTGKVIKSGETYKRQTASAEVIKTTTEALMSNFKGMKKDLAEELAKSAKGSTPETRIASAFALVDQRRTNTA